MAMNATPPDNTTLQSPSVANKLTRQTLASHLAVSLRYVDELTRKGVLPYFKIGKSIRYDLAEVEAALRERFHVRAKARRSTHSTAA